MYFRLGRGIGREILERLEQANNILIVSPWIGDKPGRIIKKRAKEASIKIVTTEEGLKSISSPVFGILSFISLLLFFFTGILLFPVTPVAALLPLLGVITAILLREDRPVVPVIVIPELHAKIYIFDDTAILSSANLTEAGLFKNVEFMAVLRGEMAEQVRGEVERLFKEFGSEKKTAWWERWLKRLLAGFGR